MVNFSPARVTIVGIFFIAMGTLASLNLIEVQNINTATGGPFFVLSGVLALIGAYFWQFGFSHFKKVFGTEETIKMKSSEID